MPTDDAPSRLPQSHVGADDAELVARRTAQAEGIIQDVLDKKVAIEDVTSKLRDLGLSPGEAKVYLDMLEQALEHRGPTSSSGKESTVNVPRPLTPEGLSDPELSAFRARRDREYAAALQCAEAQEKAAVDEAAWGALDVVANTLKAGKCPATRGGARGSSLDDIDLLTQGAAGQETSSREIPASVLLATPHLASLVIEDETDPIIVATWKLRRAFATEKAIEAIIDRMQAQPLAEPLPRSIWKLVVQDLYVEFSKLHTAIDPSSHFQYLNESKELGGLMLVKKEHILGSKEVRDEAEWHRVFGAWEAAVLTLYPHRKLELKAYRSIVEEHFRIAPSQPAIAIRFDRDVRYRYSKKPFRMDDRGITTPTSLANILAFSSPAQGSKKTSSGRASLSKRLSTPCWNWNSGFCQDPCVNRRLHGVCCECGAAHMAKSNPTCFAALQTRQREAGRRDVSEGGPSRKRARTEDASRDETRHAGGRGH